MTKTQNLDIVVHLTTNLIIDTAMVKDAIEKLVINHPDYDKQKTVATVSCTSVTTKGPG